MKRLMTLLTVLISISAFSADKATFRIGSYNLWMSNLGKGDNVWELRKARLAQSIADVDFDIFGAQEVDLRTQEELPELIRNAGGADYEWFVFSPYTEDGGVGDRAQALLYKKGRFEILEANHFWFSETPEVKSTGWDEKKFFRGAFCVIMKDLKSGMKFFVMHSHMPLGDKAKNHAAEIIVEKAKQYNPENLPSFFLGDLNSIPDSKPSAIFRDYWKDAFLELPYKKRKGPEGTFNSKNPKKNMHAARRIDYIYYGGNALARKYVCHAELYDGCIPSDHYPIYIEAKIWK